MNPEYIESNKRIEKEQVIGNLRAHPEDMALLKKFLEQEEIRAEETSQGNLEIAILEVDVFEEAGRYKEAYDACDQAIRIAEQFDENKCEELIKRAIEIKSKII